MSSLFSQKRIFDTTLVSLPSYCVPGSEADSLRAKRDAQLKWMREHGVRYLGNPAVTPDRRAKRPPSASVYSIKSAIERPGDAIVRDLASNG
jgi:hypothetical protein